jgi:hypothetical protein
LNVWSVHSILLSLPTLWFLWFSSSRVLRLRARRPQVGTETFVWIVEPALHRVPFREDAGAILVVIATQAHRGSAGVGKAARRIHRLNRESALTKRHPSACAFHEGWNTHVAQSMTAGSLWITAQH